MPGFGSGPFGHDPFGEWGWSRNVLYETAPETYRNAQTPESDFLRKYTQGQQPSFDNLRHRIEAFGDLRDPFKARSSTSEVEFLVLGKQVQPTSSTEQAGNLGVVGSAGTFTANDRTAHFRSSDIGKQIYIRRSNVAANNQQNFTITSVINSKAVFTDPLISVDAGPMRWELRSIDSLPEGQVEVEIRGGDPRRVVLGWSVNDGSKSYEVVSRQMFYQPVTSKKLLLDREGSDGNVALSRASLDLAYLTTASTSPYAPVCTTVLQADAVGTGGNGIRLRFVQDALAPAVGSLTAVGNDFTFTFLGGTTTVANFESAVAAFANCPFSVQMAGAAATLTTVSCVFGFTTFSGGGLSELSSTSYSFQQQDVGKLIGFSEATVAANNGLWEIAGVQDGKALFGVLGVAGDGSDPNGKLLYFYTPDANKRVTVEHVYDRQPGLTLSLTYSETVEGRIDISARLATDATSAITTTPSDIVAAIAADSVISGYISATRPYNVGTETVVEEFAQAPIKPAYVAPDGPFYWGLRPFARLVLQGSLPLGILELDGTDLVIPARVNQPAAVLAASRTQVTSASSPFKSGDAGKLLTIRGSAQGNDGTYVIYSADSGGTSAVLEAALNVNAYADSNLYWGIRTNPTFVPDPTRLNPQAEEVEASAEALLNILAYDFGIEVDNQQTDSRQRSWVRQVSQWTAVKGTPEALEGIATLCGFTASVTDLYSIPAHPLMGSSTTPLLFDIYFVGERFYSGGTITRVAGFPYITLPTASFLTSDLGKVLKLDNSGRPLITTNNNHYVIAEVVSSTQVRVEEPSVGANLDAGLNLTLPDPNNGSLDVTVGQLYTGIPPEFPRMDDIDFDTLAVMYNEAGYPLNDRPGLDVPCDVQPIQIGHDFDGYAKSELDCSTLGIGYTAILEAHMAGAGGDDIVFNRTPSASFRIYVGGTGNKTLFVQAVNGVTTQATVDAAIGGMTISNVTNSSGVIRIQTATPHGMVTGENIRISGVLGTVEANGTWKIVVASPTTFDLISSAFIHAYVSGGTATNVAVANLVAVKTAGGAGTLNAASVTTNFFGGVGNTPPQVVTLDPPTGLVITGVVSSGFVQTVTIEGEDLRVITYPSKNISNVADNGSGAIRVTTSTPHALVTNNNVTINGVLGTTEANGTWTVTVISTTQFDLLSSTFTNPYTSGGTVLNNDAPLGEWLFVDDTGTVFYMDGLPTLISSSPWTWEVQTTATVQPSTGFTYFQYLCPLSITCDYCPSYKVRIELTAGQVVDEGAVAQENAYERTMARINEVLPAHSEAVYSLVAPFESPALFAYASGSFFTTP
jgi:hypothetical protein